jgi:hypothetical protein
VRHATQEDLDRLEKLLAKLRELPQLRERKRGYFSRGSRAFLHFHEDAGDFYVDVRLGDDFERVKVTTPAEQEDFVSRLRHGLQPAAASAGHRERGQPGLDQKQQRSVGAGPDSA